MSERVGAALRRTVIARARARCEYCGMPDTETLIPHEPDHVIATQHGGRTTLDNLAYACFQCNRCKGPNLASLDPETGLVTPLYNPRVDVAGTARYTAKRRQAAQEGGEETCTMVTQRKTPIDFSTFPESDGEPVAENRTNLVQMTDLIFALEQYLAPRERFAVGGNQFIYYNPEDGHHHVSPDVYAALDVAPGWREKWETWREGGKFPDVVFEITSPSTQQEDLGAKVRLYGRLGAQEYYIYDPEQELKPPLRAYERAGTGLVERPVPPELAVYSPALGAELRVVGRWLRLIDPATGEPVPVPQEEHQALQAAEERAVLAEERAMLEEQARQAAQARARAEEQARQAAEERAAQAEEQAHRLQQALREAQAAIERLRGEAGG